MKKLLSFLLVFVIIISNVKADNVYTNPYDESQEALSYFSIDNQLNDNITKIDGVIGYNNFIKNYDFNDETGLYKKAAIELAALGITKGVGNKKFNGGTKLKNIEALTMLIRMLGINKGIEDRVKQANPDIPYKKLTGYFYDAYVEDSYNKGILDEKNIRFNDEISREDMALWMVNATKIKNESVVDTYIKDQNDISNGRKDSIITVLNTSLMTTFNDGTFKPKNSVKRRHFAKILDSALNRFPEVINLEKKFGIVVGIQKEEENGNSYTNVIMKNDNNELEIVRYGTLQNKLKTGFPVLNGNLNYPSSIQKGMELEFLIKEGKIVLATVLNQNQVKNKIIQKYLAEKDIDIIQGVVMSNTFENINTDDEKLERRRIRVEMDNDSLVDFVEEKNRITNIDNDLLVLNKNGFIPAAALKNKTNVTAYIKDGKVIFLSTGKNDLKLIAGTLRYIQEPLPVLDDKNKEKAKQTPGYIKVYADSKKLYQIPVNSMTGYLVNSYPAQLKDLKVGARVNVSILRGEANYINAFSYQPPSGYIPEKGKIEFVTVKSLYDNYFTVKENEQKIKFFDNQTLVKKGLKTVKFSDIKAGDKLKLYYDDIYSDAPSKILIEVEASLVQDVLKAKVYDYSRSTGFLNLENLEKMKNSKWNKISSYLKKYQLNDDTDIYSGSRKISKNSVNPKSGDNVYMIVRNNQIAKIIFSDKNERNFNTTVKKFDNVLNNITLNNGRALIFGEDTIFVENNRLVTKENLRNGASLEIVSNAYGENDSAKIVSILAQEKGLYNKVYVGYIDQVDEYSFTIYDYFVFNNANFSNINQDFKQISLYNDSMIYNSDLKKYINPKDLFHGDYYKKKYKEKGQKKKISNKGLEYKRYYGVFFVNDRDDLIAAKIRYKGLFEYDLFDDELKKESEIVNRLEEIKSKLSYSKGYIDSFNNEWNNISLKNSYNYFEYDNKWKLNDENTVISLKNALIVKNGKSIKYKDLRIDDKVYAIRNDEKVLFLYVED